MSEMASQTTSLMVVYTTVYSGANQRKYQSSVSLAFVRGIHRWPVNSLHKGPGMQKMFPFDDVFMHRISVMIWEYLFIPSFIFSILLYQFQIKQQCYLTKQMGIIMEWNSTQTIQSWITENWWHILCISMVELKVSILPRVFKLTIQIFWKTGLLLLEKKMIRSGHDFVHVAYWLMQNHDLIQLSRSWLKQKIFTKFQLINPLWNWSQVSFYINESFGSDMNRNIFVSVNPLHAEWFWKHRYVSAFYNIPSNLNDR